MKIQSLKYLDLKWDGGVMFGVVPKVLWNKVYPEMNDNLVPITLRSLVVETDSRVILIDTGIGDKLDEKTMGYYFAFGGDGLLGGLAKCGYKPGDITDVVHTHLHFDHCGGSTKCDSNGNIELTFPNAKYHVSRAQWDEATNPNEREADSYPQENILPMEELGALNIIEEDCELAPGVELRLFNGHTSGQIVPIIHAPNGSTIAFAADVIPTAAHIPIVWNMSYDIRPLETMEEKERLLVEALEGKYILVYEHDYYTECSTLKQTPKGIRMGESLTLAQALA